MTRSRLPLIMAMSIFPELVQSDDVYCHNEAQYKLCVTVRSAEEDPSLQFGVTTFSKPPRKFVTEDMPFVWNTDDQCWIPRDRVSGKGRRAASGDVITIFDTADESNSLVLTNIRASAKKRRRSYTLGTVQPSRKREGVSAPTTPSRQSVKGRGAASKDRVEARKGISHGMPMGKFCNAEPIHGLASFWVDLMGDYKTVNGTFHFYGSEPSPKTGFKELRSTGSLPLARYSLAHGPGDEVVLWSVARELTEDKSINPANDVLETVGKETGLPLLNVTNIHIAFDQASMSMAAVFASEDIFGSPALWVALNDTEACGVSSLSH
ncbi:hypothetical protein FOZ61_002796 [Perkinsus olseni]|uniref:Uncharacterized protein n=1 Tax=Perkinsus olseni TaxID=32597 RepID=A0A7J6MD12_PEROL|nr:hypothetical protein FOZ61_002796 [Perkinsus olseni]KAF4669266.1 hypothetical protein FOL46_001526 [Perkinsus olseni]